MNHSAAEIWLVIALLAVGTFAIRFSFLGLIGDRPMPPLVLRLLRYTPVAVLPGMVAPMVLWPSATGGSFDPPRAAAALAALGVGLLTRNMLLAALAGAVALYGGLYLLS
ncbi:AzlD domain-containing protein [Profundibacterium mesophilum]|uniref:Conserved inner membrane protein n=1 Tax=Profundibacterium mesophilum KAUST100406-0324 TaxID=1037889 RepID=A0A921NVJ4_9RHOB|nr:AzlD domain-containing protein [Profundibacterium mesophilum]KAF0676428.1 putative conserved inner membrane protein [Profundibacterium mesophilum KAUST100406-0324]